MTRNFLMFVLWFNIAGVLDSVIRRIQENLPEQWEWLHLQSLAFCVVLWIGAWIGRNYPGWWMPLENLNKGEQHK